MFWVGCVLLFVGGAIGFLGGALIIGALLWVLQRYSDVQFSVGQRRWFFVPVVAGLAANFVVNPGGIPALLP